MTFNNLNNLNNLNSFTMPLTLTSNARAYTHVDNGKVKRNYLIFDDNLVVSGTDIPPCRIVETGLNLKQFTKVLQDAFSDTVNYTPSPGGRSKLEDVLELTR